MTSANHSVPFVHFSTRLVATSAQSIREMLRTVAQRLVIIGQTFWSRILMVQLYRRETLRATNNLGPGSGSA